MIRNITPIARFKPGKKKCKNCQCDFEKDPRQPFKPCCSTLCTVEWNKKLQQRKEERQSRNANNGFIQAADHIETLQDEINAIARKIDYEQTCISCNRRCRQPHAGHYHGVGANATLRFNLHDIHVQDFTCNVEKGGNKPYYDAGLIRVYGQEYWEYVKFKLPLIYKDPLKLSGLEVKEKITLARQLKREIPNEWRNPIERIELRNQINQLLEMYPKNFILYGTR